MTASRGIGVTAYGCDPVEAAAFGDVASGLGVVPTITSAALSMATAGLASGSRCISVDHRTPIENSTLRAVREVGVEYISTRSAGSDHIDVDFARSLGITVEGVAYSPGSVADFTVMLILMAIRGARSIVTRADGHDFRLNEVRGRDLCDMTVGVIGTGRIGAAVVDRLQGFGCRVLAHDRRVKTSAEYASLDQVLGRSDVITLHTPLTVATTHLLDRRRIERMRPGAFVVNTGRGALIDTEALVWGLETGRLGGAALDVVEEETGIFYSDRREDPVESELFTRLHSLPNVLITPHTAYYTQRALADVITITLTNSIEFEGRQHD